MTRRQTHLVWIGAGLFVLAGLLYFTVRPAGLVTPAAPLAWVLFTLLFVCAMTFGVPLAGGMVNIAPTVAVGGLLVMGPLPAAWMVFAGALANIALRRRFAAQLEPAPSAWREQAGLLPLLGVGLANASILALSLAAAAAAYVAAGGEIPLLSFNPGNLSPYLLLVLTFSLVNYALAAAHIRLQAGRRGLAVFRRALPRVALFELAPQVFTPLLPLIYNRLGPGAFALFGLLVLAACLATRSLSLTSQRLRQRVSHFNALTAMGQALAASLQLESVLAALREHLPRVVPADSLYVALYDSAANEVSFPMVLEHGQAQRWHSRPAGQGLTDQVLRTRQPLLISDTTGGSSQALAEGGRHRVAVSWVGVPILAGSEALGVLAVQSFSPEAARYSEADRDLLATIAAQIAAALNNARLYGRTDQALSQRVQQLSSILATTREGMLLLGPDTQVITGNPALARFVGLPLSDLTGRILGRDSDLAARLGVRLVEFHHYLAELTAGHDLVKRTYALPGPPPREVEWALAAVRGDEDRLVGWLIVLRDVSEEQALARLREDLTHMLIHDLRSPLGSMLTSLSIIEQMARPGELLDADVLELTRLAQSGGRQMLRLINQLLEIARLESGEVPLNRQLAAPADLLAGGAERHRAAAEAAGIRLEVAPAAGLPALAVDQDLISRVLDNLVDNALKFTPNHGQVRLWARAERPAGQNGAQAAWVTFGITDQGPGIAPEHQPLLFKKFQHVPRQVSRRGGTGLGLAFCKLAVEAHGGRIWVENGPGQGSTFAFTLPISGSAEYPGS